MTPIFWEYKLLCDSDKKTSKNLTLRIFFFRHYLASSITNIYTGNIFVYPFIWKKINELKSLFTMKVKYFCFAWPRYYIISIKGNCILRNFISICKLIYTQGDSEIWFVNFVHTVLHILHFGSYLIFKLFLIFSEIII